MARKIYILDTNVLINDPDAINAFEDNIVIIPTQVIEELDDLKSERSDRGYNVRRAIRNLNTARGNGKLHEGVPVGNGGVLRVYGTNEELKNELFETNKADNNILHLAHDIALNGIREKNGKTKYKTYKTVLVSDDVCMGIKADALNVEVQTYKHDAVEDEDLDYLGREEAEYRMRYSQSFATTEN